MDLSTLQSLLQLGWPALVTIAVVYVFKLYTDSLNNQIDYLRKRIDALEAKQAGILERMSAERPFRSS